MSAVTMRYQAWVHGTMDMGFVEATGADDARAQVLAILRADGVDEDCRGCGAGRTGPVENCIEIAGVAFVSAADEVRA